MSNKVGKAGSSSNLTAPSMQSYKSRVDISVSNRIAAAVVIALLLLLAFVVLHFFGVALLMWLLSFSCFWCWCCACLVIITFLLWLLRSCCCWAFSKNVRR